MFIFLTIGDEVFVDRLQTLYELYRRDMYVVALHHLKNPTTAEDVVHTAVLKLSRHIDKLTNLTDDSTRAYVIKTVVSICKNLHKSSNKLVNQPVEEILATRVIDDYLENHIIYKERQYEIQQTLNHLKPSYLEIIRLRFYCEYTIEEISDILGITKDNVSVRLYRALKSTEKLLKKRSDIDEFKL